MSVSVCCIHFLVGLLVLSPLQTGTVDLPSFLSRRCLLSRWYAVRALHFVLPFPFFSTATKSRFSCTHQRLKILYSVRCSMCDFALKTVHTDYANFLEPDAVTGGVMHLCSGLNEMRIKHNIGLLLKQNGQTLGLIHGKSGAARSPFPFELWHWCDVVR